MKAAIPYREATMKNVSQKQAIFFGAIAFTLLVWAAFQIIVPIISRTEEANFHAVSSMGTVESIDAKNRFLTLADVGGAAKENGDCTDGEAIFDCEHLSATSGASLNDLSAGDRIRIEHLPTSVNGSLQAGLIEIIES